ncbi:MAG: insulinase family protein [Pseudomonadota bacterium]
MFHALLLPALLAPAIHARPSLDLKIEDYAIETRDFCFASGLRVSFQEDHSQPVVSVTSVVDHGSDSDPVGKEGIAHLIEHLWFRSEREGLPKVWDLLLEMGADINAFTANDVTAYMTVAPRAMLPAVLELEAARLTDAVQGVTPETLDAERDVVRNELREGEAVDVGIASLFAKLYPEGHPYHHTTIGTRDTLDSITLGDVQGFVDSYYTPENATILVVGDFSMDDAPQLLAEAFPPELVFAPGHPEGPASAEACPVRVTGPSDPPPSPIDRSIDTIEAPVDRPTAIMAWTLPGGYRPDEPLMEITSMALTWAVSTYINPPNTPPWRDQNEAFCYLYPGELASTAVCAIELKDDADPKKVIGKAADGLYQLWDPETRPWQAQAFSRASLQYMAGVFRTADEVASLFSGRGASTAIFTHFTGSTAYYSTSFNWLGAVQGEQAAMLANRYLNRDRYAAVVLTPYADSEERGLVDEASYTGHPREAAKVTVVDLDTIDGDAIAALTVAPDLTAMRDLTLDNGLRVVLYPYGSVPLTRVALAVRGGDLYEPLPGLDHFSWDNTISEPSDLEIPLDEAPLRVGGEWEDYYHDDIRVLQVNGSSANLEAQLWLMLRRLQSMKIDQHDGRAYAREMRRELTAHRELPSAWAYDLTQTTLYGQSPFGKHLDDATIASVEALTEAQPAHWTRQVFQPGNATLLVVGRFDPDQAEATVRRQFEGWAAAPDAGAPPALVPPPTARPDRHLFVLDKPQVSQTEVRMACLIAPAKPGDQEARDLLAGVLDELAWVTLRENSGVTYGAGAWIHTWAGGASSLVMGSTVQSEAAGFAAQTFLGLVDRASRGDLDAQTLKLQALKEARGYVLGQQSTSQMIERLAEPLRMDRGWEELTEHGRRLGAVTVDQLPPLMEGCQGHEVLTLVGPAEQVEASLAKVGLTGERFDWEAERDRLWAENDPKGWKSEQKRRVE